MAPVDTILLSPAPGESRLALVAAGKVVEFRIDRGEAAPGDILLGRVISVNKALAAAFIEIGQPQPGFLGHVGSLSDGDTVIVQVTASARGGKGAEVTAAPSLQGGLLAYTPHRAGLNLSRRIADEAERTRLSALLKPLLSAEEGAVVRTQAAGASDAALLDELTALRQDWAGLQAKAAQARPPAVLRAPSPLERLLAEHASVRKVLTDDAAALADVKALFPAAELHRGGALFEQFEADEVLEQALLPRVPLPGGGSLVIGTAAGITVVDIDSGPGAPIDANLAAVPEIARQLRLRGISGHILVDAIPLRERRALGRVAEALRLALAEDPTPTQLVGTTPLGMIELTRDRRGPSLAETLLAEQPVNRSADSLALDGLRALLREAEAAPGRLLALAAPAAVLTALRRRTLALAEAERRLGHGLRLIEQADLSACQIIEATS